MTRRPPSSTRPDTLFPYTTLFRSVPAGAAAAVRCAAVDGVRKLLDQPGLSVLDPHRAHREALAANRIHLQYAIAPPCSSRYGPAIPRQELRNRKSTRLNSSH